MARILIIDDDSDLVQLLQIALRERGHEVDSASRPSEGLEVCRKFSPDLILLDYHMPGATGAHLFETFRRNNATATTPIIFMSAVASSEQVVAEISESSHSRFMQKPIHIKTLFETIENMLAAEKP